MQLFCPTVELAVATGTRKPKASGGTRSFPLVPRATIPFETGRELPNVVGVHPRRVFSVSYEENTLFFV